MPHISDRLRELSCPTGEEDLLTVSYPRPRISVPPWIACTIAVLVAAGILVWLGISSRAEPYAATSPTSSTPAPSSLVVSVVGEVDNPGLVTVAPDARIADALDHARPKPGIDLRNLNLAKRLTDGEQIVVGMPAPVPGSAGEPGQGPLSLNTATKEQLMDLKGVGEVTAEAIIAHREEIGGFSSVEQLMDISGIGPAKFEGLKDQVQP